MIKRIVFFIVMMCLADTGMAETTQKFDKAVAYVNALDNDEYHYIGREDKIKLYAFYQQLPWDPVRSMEVPHRFRGI